MAGKREVALRASRDMVVDFELRRAPAMRTISVSWRGPYKEQRIRSEFEGLERYAKEHKLAPKHWIFTEGGGRWGVALEVKGAAKGNGQVRLRTYPATKIAAIAFDPDAISPRVAYHGMSDWLKWRKKEGDISRVGAYREVYAGNPWRDAKAWKRCEIQVRVK